MADELEKLLTGAEDTPVEPSAKEPEKEPEAPKKSEAEVKEEEKLANLKRAQTEALAELQRIRKQTKAAKTGVELEDELPKINLEDPSSKAWDRHMADKVNPLAIELERERNEVTRLALGEFLADKPALAKNSEKLKEFVRDYKALAESREITGRNKDVIMEVMESAYAAVLHNEILTDARKRRVDQAKADSLLADIATDTGSTTFRNERPQRRQLGNEEREAILKMYGSEDAYWEAVDKVHGA